MKEEQLYYIEEIRENDPALADKIVEDSGFITEDQIPFIEKVNRFIMVLVRCGRGRLLCPVQDAKHFIDIINKSEADYVRDVCLPTEPIE